MTNNKLMTKNEIIEMQREVFKREGNKYKVTIPLELIDYLESTDHSNTWKGKFILLFMGVYLTYREAYYTYRVRSMNINNIMQLMNLNPENRELSSEFSKNGFLAKEKIITHVNDLPYLYEFVDKQIAYRTAKGLTKEERNLIFDNLHRRQLRAIEPTLNIKGKTRKRGRGIQVLRKPIDTYKRNTISFTYSTIQKVVSGRLTTNDLWALVVLKQMTGNLTLKSSDNFITSKNKIGKRLGITSDGYKKIHTHLTKELGEHKYKLEQRTFCVSEGDLVSEVYLNISSDI